MLAYLVREHNKTSQTRKIRKIRTKEKKKPTGVLNNVVQDQKGCKKNYIRKYVLKRKRKLLHGRNNTKTRKKIPA